MPKKVITFMTQGIHGDRIDVTPKQLAMYRRAGWPHPVVPGRAAYIDTYFGEHYGEPTYTDEQIQSFINDLPKRGGQE